MGGGYVGGTFSSVLVIPAVALIMSIFVSLR